MICVFYRMNSSSSSRSSVGKRLHIDDLRTAYAYRTGYGKNGERPITFRLSSEPKYIDNAAKTRGIPFRAFFIRFDDSDDMHAVKFFQKGGIIEVHVLSDTEPGKEIIYYGLRKVESRGGSKHRVSRKNRRSKRRSITRRSK